MTAGYIGILKQGEMFRAYYRKEKTGAWKLIQLEGETDTAWSDESFKKIFRHLQVDESTSALGILVISDKEESIDFPETQEALSFTYEELRDFCRKYCQGAAHWICQCQALDEELCQKAGFPMDEFGENQYILLQTEPIGHLEDLQVPEIPKEEIPKEEMTESTPAISVPLTEKQQKYDAYFQNICDGTRENPLKNGNR